MENVKHRTDPESGNKSISLGEVDNSITFRKDRYFNTVSVTANTKQGFVSSNIIGVATIKDAPWGWGFILETDGGVSVSLKPSVFDEVHKFLTEHQITVKDTRKKG